jgi:tetratricopeptide (TPR) repeat protein
MERVGEEQNDVVVSALGHLYHGMALFGLAEYIAASGHFEQCYHLNEPANRVAAAGAIPEDPYTMALCWHPLTLTYLGCIDRGRARLNEAFSIATGLEQPFTEAFVFVFACWITWILGSSDEEGRYADRLVELSNEHGFIYLWAIGLGHQGVSLTSSGKPREGLSLINQAMSTCRAIGAVYYTTGYLCWRAEAHSRLGEMEQSLKDLAEAQRFADDTEERINDPEIHRLRGEMLSATGEYSAAELEYQQALAVARRQNARLCGLRAATGLARLWRDQGKRAEAHDLLAPVYGWFTEGFDTPVLKDAKALLEQIAS